MKKREILIVFLLYIFSIHNFPETRFVHNTLNEINACEGKIKLTLIRVWGDDEVDDENQFFRMPSDIKISDNNLVYILDTGNHRIQIFDRSGKFIKTIGRRGKGPGDLLMPLSFCLGNDKNIIVADSSNYRIQAFNFNGKYLYIHRLKGFITIIKLNRDNQIATFSHTDSFMSKKLVSIYDFKGNLVKRIGNHIDINRPISKFGSIFFDCDKNGNIIISYYAVPLYQKYSYQGKSLLIVSYEVPFRTPKVGLNDSKEEPIVKGEGKPVSYGISVGEDDHVFLVTTTREMRENEKYFLVSDSPGDISIWPKRDYPEKTDRFRLLVFDKTGKITAAKKLDVVCDKMYVFKDRLFIIDKYLGMKIYEYKMSFN
jgi:hypothetical protein